MNPLADINKLSYDIEITKQRKKELSLLLGTQLVEQCGGLHKAANAAEIHASNYCNTLKGKRSFSINELRRIANKLTENQLGNQ